MYECVSTSSKHWNTIAEPNSTKLSAYNMSKYKEEKIMKGIIIKEISEGGDVEIMKN